MLRHWWSQCRQYAYCSAAVPNCTSLFSVLFWYRSLRLCSSLFILFAYLSFIILVSTPFSHVLYYYFSVFILVTVNLNFHLFGILALISPFALVSFFLSPFSWGTMLQAARSRVRFPMRLLDFFNYANLPAALWPWG
jgi:hypothetical protein